MHTKVSAAQFEAFLALPENADRRFELIEGKIVEKVPTEEHSLIAGSLYFALRLFVEPNALGRVLFEVRHQVPGDEHNARLPDVEFTRADRLQSVVTRGAVQQLPDLVVEVQSPEQKPLGLREKAIYYLRNGVQLIWIVFPRRREIEVWTQDNVVTLGADDVLDGDDVLPGFSVSVRELFPADEVEGQGH